MGVFVGGTSVGGCEVGVFVKTGGCTTGVFVGVPVGGISVGGCGVGVLVKTGGWTIGVFVGGTAVGGVLSTQSITHCWRWEPGVGPRFVSACTISNVKVWPAVTEPETEPHLL